MPYIPQSVRDTIIRALKDYGGKDGQRALQWVDKPPREDLTERELEIVRMAALGLSNREVGDKLFITERTVRTHITHILAKLGLPNRTRLALWAIISEVVTLEEIEQFQQEEESEPEQ